MHSCKVSFHAPFVALCLAIYTLVPSLVAADSLVENGSFDDDLAGWILSSTEGQEQSWSPIDLDGSSDSGSFFATTETDDTFLESLGVQCLDLAGGVEYRFGGKVLVPGAQDNSGEGSYSLSFFDRPACTSGLLDIVRTDSVSELETAVGLEQTVVAPDEAASGFISLRVQKAEGGTPFSVHFDDVFVEALGNTSCEPGPTTLCLREGRFRVVVRWETSEGDNGEGRPVPLTGETGYFWFFEESNVEVVLKVLNACSFADRFWVFASGLTNVGVEITVTDTANGTAKTYENPLGKAFQPILDTDAFATCP